MIVIDGSRSVCWSEYQSWLHTGNTPEPEFTPEELDAKIQQEVMYQVL